MTALNEINILSKFESRDIDEAAPCNVFSIISKSVIGNAGQGFRVISGILFKIYRNGHVNP